MSDWTAAQLLSVVTDREKRLLRRTAQGKTDYAIAREIGGTEKQIAGQRLALIRKLGIQSDAQLLAAADELAAWPAKKVAKTATRPRSRPSRR